MWYWYLLSFLLVLLFLFMGGVLIYSLVGIHDETIKMAKYIEKNSKNY